MLDYSEILLEIQKTHRQCHDVLLKRDWHTAIDLANRINLQAVALKEFCLDKLEDQ